MFGKCKEYRCMQAIKNHRYCVIVALVILLIALLYWGSASKFSDFIIQLFIAIGTCGAVIAALRDKLFPENEMLKGKFDIEESKKEIECISYDMFDDMPDETGDDSRVEKRKGTLLSLMIENCGNVNSFWRQEYGVAIIINGRYFPVEIDEAFVCDFPIPRNKEVLCCVEFKRPFDDMKKQKEIYIYTAKGNQFCLGFDESVTTEFFDIQGKIKES
ncbi:MAG: hypothetical protein LBP75_06055 [Planctomycetota bacterium]|jgi:hypothetical protein|nr:hypothetical protein [Planctomycetota bacterium]